MPESWLRLLPSVTQSRWKANLMQGASDQPRCWFAHETRQLKNLLNGDRVIWLLWS